MQKEREQQQEATTEMIDNEKSVYMETDKLAMGTHTCPKWYQNPPTHKAHPPISYDQWWPYW